MCETETDESRIRVLPTAAGSDLLTLQALLRPAAPMLRNPERFAEPERAELEAICETLQTIPEESPEPVGFLALWE